MEIDAEKISLRDLRPGDAGWLIQRHAELYAESDAFDATFEAFVADILAGYIRNHVPGLERFWIAEADGRRLGSICCAKDDEPGVAKLRLFLVEPDARGLGLGHKLIDACVGFAADAGYRSMRLWTFDTLEVACALYAKHGFTRISSKGTDAFGAYRIEQIWERPLGSSDPLHSRMTNAS